MKKLLKSILKTATYVLEQSDRVSEETRHRVREGVDRVGDRVSGLRDQARDLYGHEDHTLRNVICFTAGVGVGVGAALLCAPASGEVVRQIETGIAPFAAAIDRKGNTAWVSNLGGRPPKPDELFAAPMQKPGEHVVS